MPKHKTHKGLAKRVKITARGKIKRKKAFSGHLMSTKSGNRSRSLRQSSGMSATMTKKTRQALGQ
jgi:large subunit ribosomal protein L35